MKLTRTLALHLSLLVLPLALAVGAPTRAHAQQDDKAPAAETADKLVADLGADDYQKREEAQKKLVALGRKALPALQQAEKDSKDAEVRARAHEAIAAINKDRPDAAPGREKKGELEPTSPKVEEDPDEPAVPRMPKLNDLFRGSRDLDGEMPEALKKMLEQIQKQFEGMDRQAQRELQPGPRGDRNGVRIQITQRPKTPVELKLGVALVPPAPALAAQLSLAPTDGGLVVNELTPGLPAWKVGLQRYDVVLTIDGKAVRNPADLATLGQGDAKVEVLRKAQKTVVLVHKIESAPTPPGGSTGDNKPAEKPSTGDAPTKPEEPARKF